MSSWKLHTDCALLRHDHGNQIISTSADCSETRMQPRERTDGRLANRQRPVAYSVRVLLAVARIPEEHSMSAGLSPQRVNSSSTDLQRSRGARREPAPGEIGVSRADRGHVRRNVTITRRAP